MTRLFFLCLLIGGNAIADEQVSIRFRAMLGSSDARCGQNYSGIGTGTSMLSLRDLRFYVHALRLIDDSGKEAPSGCCRTASGSGKISRWWIWKMRPEPAERLS
jgi:hypothetical protein